MPRTTLLAAGALAAVVLGACAGAPLKTRTPDGLAYECDVGGPAVIRFDGGGYLPDATARGKDQDGQPAQVLRSTAELTYRGAKHRMVAEWTEGGLRYRSDLPADGGRYLIWSQQGEVARLVRRASAMPGDQPDGETVARCRRSGRARVEGDAAPHAVDAELQHQKEAPAHQEPHRR